MPRYFLPTILLFLLFNQTSKGAVRCCSGMFVQTNTDTLAFEHEMAHHPFLIDTLSVEAIKMLFGSEYQISKKPIRNRFIKNQTDTLITITKGKSYIRLYVVSKADKCFYEAAEIQDNFPVFRESVRIGQSKADIQKLFPVLAQTRHIPDYIEIAAGEGTDYLYLLFRKGALYKIEFRPYLD